MEFLTLGFSDERFQEKVDDDLHCPICMNVLREPVHCGPNEHYFCTTCITTHLTRSQKCPNCQAQLSEATLKPPSRFVTSRLNRLVISCDNQYRGCEDLMKLEMLSHHIKTCSFSPVQCPNKGCSANVNRNDYERHIKSECEFRERCSDCAELKEELVLKLEEATEALRSFKQSSYPVEENHTVAKAVDYVRQDFVIMGGRTTGNKALNCVDMFHWSTMTWERLKPLHKARFRASSFVYNGQVVIAGGSVNYAYGSKPFPCKSIEKIPLTARESAAKWSKYNITLPVKKSAHKCVVYQDRLLVIGGFDDKQGEYADAIHNLRLKPPYSAQILARMPTPREYFGVEIFGDRMVIVGGKAKVSFDTCLKRVTEYNLKKNTFQDRPLLPFPVTAMATVAWQDKLVILGGMSKQGTPLDSVILYDVGSGQSTMLPNMLHKRGGASAIVTGHVIVVMGGVNETGKLASVEYFNFCTYTWQELASLDEARSYASASVKPHC